ncbi:MAG: carboxypeptidase regulatory-like domain-containing protein, partial [Pyrinomonadaceae bacterium]|nr:carboxypeptidase regulatory-like domain-containing protein [Pyrinomonadaceae bacterium]
TGLADSFNPTTNSSVLSIAVQPDGKILAGGTFITLSPNGGATVTRNRIARFERDGRLDQTLNLSTVGSSVVATAIQPDGKIIIGGGFTSVLGTPRNNIARLNTDGTLDLGFDPNANSGVSVIAVQTDGKILAGGGFTTIGGQPRNNIARLDATTGLADSFNPNPNNFVFSIAVQSDGKILAGGFFTNIGGQSRSLFARLSNDTAALSTLTVTKTTVTLTRNGSAAQFSRVTFEQSTDNGATYTLLGSATNSFAAPAGDAKGDNGFAPSAPQVAGYTLTGLNLPSGQNILIRARGFYRTGYQNGSETTEDKVQTAFLLAPTAANIAIGGRVFAGKGRGLSNAFVVLTDMNGASRTAATNSFGYYRFDEVAAGETYILNVRSKRFRFAPQVVSVTEELTELNFFAEP